MLTLRTPNRPLVALLGAAAALTFSAGPADAAAKQGKSAKTAKASKAKAVKASKARADLTVRNLFIDVNDDGSLAVDAALLNVGRKFARSSDLVIALSDDNKLDDQDEVLDELPFERIGAGVRRSVSDDIDIPDDVDTSDELNILVCADGWNDLVEKSETNNCVSQSIVLDDVAGDDDDSSDDSSAADDGSSSDDSSSADDGQ